MAWGDSLMAWGCRVLIARSNRNLKTSILWCSHSLAGLRVRCIERRNRGLEDAEAWGSSWAGLLLRKLN